MRGMVKSLWLEYRLKVMQSMTRVNKFEVKGQCALVDLDLRALSSGRRS